MIRWQYFPKSKKTPEHLKVVVDQVFLPKEHKITSLNHHFNSDKVLCLIKRDLEKLGFEVEKGKKNQEKIRVPVLFGEEGKCEKSFDADGWNKSTNTVIEVEAGRGVTNYQFLKDLFQTCVMQDINFLIICVRNDYLGRNDYSTVINFFNTLYASDRLKIPLTGILVVGY